MRCSIFVVLALASCGRDSAGPVEPHGDGPAATDAPSPGAAFSWQMAGALVLWSEPLTVAPAVLRDIHFSYIGQYAMNGCANNTAPYSCAANGCNYPGAPLSGEIAPSYADFAAWARDVKGQGLYAGAWAVTYNAPEAEAHCMAEIANTLHADHGVTLDFWIVDAEKSYETHKAEGYTQRFVDTFDGTIAFPLAKAEAPECHIDIDYPTWASHGYAIQSQAYWNAYGLPPSYCLDWVSKYGVPAELNTVMLDGYATGGEHAPADYAADIASFHGVGFSIWRTLAADAWPAWKPLIESGIATY